MSQAYVALAILAVFGLLLILCFILLSQNKSLRIEKANLEASIPQERNEAIQQSQSTIIGKVTEHLLPYFPSFKFNPRDARFLGSPIDLIVFDGMSEGDVRKVVFIEVKTGPSANLTKREKQIKEAIDNNRVSFVELRIDKEVASAARLGPPPLPG